jgi:4a-hydroxytetrahydrobiopterin dehydratase
MPEKLNETELVAALTALPLWKLQRGEIVRSIKFGNFNEAIAFVNQVATLAESANHHPDIDIRYNRVNLALVTHDAGGITQNDIDLATAIDTAKKNQVAP